MKATVPPPMNATLTPADGSRTLGRSSESRAAEDRRLLARYRNDGDTAAREELVERFLPLARHLAKRYRRREEPLDDLFQVASVALVRSIDGFDPSRGTTFSTYAVPTILGALKRHFRDSGWTLHVPRHTQQQIATLSRASSDMQHRLGRPPTASELADELCLSPEEVHEARLAAHACETISLDANHHQSSEQPEPARARALETEEQHYELIEYGAAIASTLRALSDRDRLILNLRFIDDLTLVDIAQRLDLSEMQVSRNLQRSLARLRAVVA